MNLREGTPRLLRRGRKRRIIPFRQIVPSAITTLSLCSGLASIHFALTGDWERSMLAIGLAAVLDSFDGMAARLLKAQSKFGAVLDSLADFLSFGVAPAMLLHQWMLKGADVFGTAAIMTFVLCSALRLARFTSMPDRPKGNPALSKFFQGMPTPAAAGAVCIPPMLDASKTLNYTLPAWAVVANTLVIALLMISTVPMFAVKHAKVKRRQVPVLLVLLGLVVVGMMRDLWLALAGIAGLYLLTTPLCIWRYRQIKAGNASVPESPVQA